MSVGTRVEATAMGERVHNDRNIPQLHQILTQMVYTRKLRIDEAQLPEIIAANTKWFIRANQVVV
jgi:hypothetical protein